MKKLIMPLLFAVALVVESAAQDISKIDKNFEPQKIGNIEFCFYNEKAPFKVEGLPWLQRRWRIFEAPERHYEGECECPA